MTELPAPVARFRDEALREGPASVGTMTADASAWMRRRHLPPIPLAFRMAHRLGREFVHVIRIGRGPLSFRFGLDAYVDGHGLMRVGPSSESGVQFDQGALIALWAEALAIPACWEPRDDVRWEPIDDRTASLIVRGPEGDIPITVAFEPRTGRPAWCEADRYKSTGPKVRWRGTITAWRRVGGVLAPAGFLAQWADDPAPWLEMRIGSMRFDAPIDAILAEGRRHVGRITPVERPITS